MENGESVRSGLTSLRTEDKQQSRLVKLLIPSAIPAATQLSEADELDELEEEDVWATDERDVGSVGDGERLWRSSSNLTPDRLVVDELNVTAAWGAGDNIRVQRSSEKDSIASGLVAGERSADATKKVNAFSANFLLHENGSKNPSGTREGTSRRILTPSRMIPRRPFEETARRAMHQSAPMNVPDWSKILKVENLKKPPVEMSDDDWEDEYGLRLPPHQLLSRKYAQSQMINFSVFEGVGRTLRGRDLSRVRNAVLTRTGFLE